jgi:hypothetical protein
MKKVLLVGIAYALLASTNAWSQAAIPQCRNAAQTLRYYGLYQAAGNLIQKDCPAMYQAGWLTGTGKVIQVKNPDGTITNTSPLGCDSAWNSLSAIPDAMNAARELVTRNCPDIYYSGFRPGPLATAPIPACTADESTLTSLGKLVQTGNFIKNRCAALHQNGWLIQLGGTWSSCPVILDSLTTSGALATSVDLIQHNCPSLYQGTAPYITSGAPIQP